MNNPIQNNIINALDLRDLSPEQREEILISIGGLIYQNVLIRAMDIMADEDQDEFERLLDDNAGPEEIFTFLKDAVEGFENIVEEEALKFRDKSSNIMNQIGN